MTQLTTQPPVHDQAVVDDLDPRDQRRRLLRLAISLALLLFISAGTGTFSTVAVILAFVAMIMLHEFGHFVTAKLAGMKVTEYFLGFGPRLWSVRKGETEYGVKALPLGGYVRVIGMSNLEQIDPADEHRTYRAKPYWRRMSVAVAGSTMHFVIALGLLFALFAGVGIPDSSRSIVREIYAVKDGPSPAQEAGFRVGDEILRIDGQDIESNADLGRFVRPRAGQNVEFVVRRGGREITLIARPIDRSTVDVVAQPGEAPIVRPTEPTGFLGVTTGIAYSTVGPMEAIGNSFSEFGNIAKGSVSALGRFFSPDRLTDYGRLLTEAHTDEPADADAENNRFLSPVGFVRVAGQAADTGLRNVLMLLVLINIFVGLFNLVPLLPLDGGHVAIATYERIRSRKGRPYRADVAKLLPITYGVVVVLLMLAATSLWLDIFRPLANPFE